MKRKLNIKLIIIISIVFIIAVTCFILFFTTDFFRTKRSVFLRYFEGTGAVFDILKEDEFASYQKQKRSMPYIRNANLAIQNSSNIADSNILDKLKMTMVQKNDYENEKMNADITINHKGQTLEKISVIKNKSAVGFYCKDIADGYITVENNDLKRIAENFGISDVTYIPNTINEINLEKIFETSKLENNKLKNCLTIIKNKVPNTAYKKEGRKRIKINDESYSTNAYSLTLNEAENASLQIDLLSKISQDSILMDYITSKCRLLNFNEEYTNLNSINEKMKLRIEELKRNPEKAGTLAVTVYEYRQKNIRTEIINGDNKITINHIKDGNKETSSIKVNDKLYMIQKDGDKYIITYKDDSNETSYNIEYTQSGTIEENNIQNKIVLTKTSGIKSITYVYDDTINFTNNIGKLDTFDGKKTVLINNQQNENLKDFFKDLKGIINTVYINKGASIGINLDPLFEI